MDDDMSVNCVGLLIAYLMLIPHYILLILLLSAKFFQNKQNKLLKFFYFSLFCLGAVGIIPVTFCIDFWGLAAGYSNMSFEEATSKAFFEFSHKYLTLEEEVDGIRTILDEQSPLRAQDCSVDGLSGAFGKAL